MRVGRLALVALVWMVACEAEPPMLTGLRLGQEGSLVVVLVHGYGSRPEDLAPFAARTDLPPGTRVLLPRAPAELRPPRGREGGRMWWDFPGNFSDLRRQRLDGVREAQRALSRWLDQETRPTDRVVLGGFSQGAMLALDLAAHDPRPLAGLMLSSGTLMDEAELRPRLAARAGLPVRITHGRADDVLPFARAQDLRALLVASGLDVRFEAFDGGHEVTSDISAGSAAFVRELAASP